MSRKVLLAVHGMGQHTAESFGTEVRTGINDALALYPLHDGKTADDLIDIIPVVYGDIFDEYRVRISSAAGTLAERIARIEGPSVLLKNGLQELNALEVSLNDDAFFNTHWLDVILYRYTLLSEKIRLRVAEAIGVAIREHGGADVHVLGHSLGTAVLHDALAKSYGPENLLSEDGERINLDTKSHRLGGVHMIANVSRALQTFVKAGSSIVRPGERGCTAVFTECRHRLDPITLVRPFTPTDNALWVTHDVFQSNYQLVEQTSVTAASVHSLPHYLADPAVHTSLFKLLFKHNPLKNESEAASEKYHARTVQGKARMLQQAFGDLQFNSDASVNELLTAAKDLKDLVEGFGETF